MVAVSLVRSSENIDTVRELLARNNARDIQVIAKIENMEGLNNFEEILHEADGVMIARSPLSMELSAEKVFIAQKWMI